MIRRLSKSIREYKKQSILTSIFVIAEVIIEVAIPFLMAALIDFGIDVGNLAYVYKMGLFLLVLALFALLFGVLAGTNAATASAGFAKNLRKDIFYNLQTFSFSNIDKFSTASIITRLTTDVNNIQHAFQLIIRTAVRSPIMLLFSLFVSFRINAKLSMIFLASTPVLGLGLYLIIKKAHPIFVRVFKKYDTLNRVVQENLRGIRVVKSFTREEFENSKFDDISTKIYRDFSKAERILAFNAPLMQFCMYGCTLLVSWFGARMIVSAGGDPSLGFSTGQFMSLITYTIQILVSLMMLSMVFVMITISKASSERIVEVLEEVSDLNSKDDAVKEVKNGEIIFDHVCFSYNKSADKLVLNDVSFSILSGETVGIIGGTGSSKSTLVQLIPRLYDIDSGKITVGGVEVRDYDLETLRNQVAMVLQKNVLFSGSIKKNLLWGNENATDEELTHACKLAQADEFIQTFPDKYDTYIEQDGSNVSGGQKQRLCIARALLKKPKILILDDSTSAVDTKTDAQIRKAFREEIPDTTKIIIAQRVSSIQDADKIIVLDDGKIVDVGNHFELIQRCTIYKEVFESQAKGGIGNE